ncbi:MAG: sulfur oxidation c-type cytochrome SoxX [Gammaproteobacteria bacterium]|jgi:sulfur-oxidizing protein SoxX
MMRKFSLSVLLACVAATVIAVLLPASVTQVQAATAAEEGKALAFDRKKGNCLACHMIEGGDLAGNIGPPLLAMQQRFPDRTQLRAQIWDSTVKNPQTMMPPFGRHRILTEDEIDKIVDFLYTL